MSPPSDTRPLPLPGRARAVAYEMLRAAGVLGSNSMVAPFIESYAARFDRPGLKDHPLRYRELLTTIGRESLLAMTAKMQRELPRLLSRRTGLLLGSAAEAAEAFKREFFESLAGALDWSPADRDEFRRDLDVYAQLGAQDRRSGRFAGGSHSEPAGGPFADRCALLLDPSMLLDARQASVKFLAELEACAEQILREAFRATPAKRQ